jgi:hypothetical protein
LKEACCGSTEEKDFIAWLLQDEPEATLFDILGAEGVQAWLEYSSMSGQLI